MDTVQSRSGAYHIRIILGALFAVIVADGIITVFLIQNGIAQEGNPFLAYWVTRDLFLVFKVLGGFLATLYLFFFHRRHPKLALWFSSLCLLAYTAILLWNLFLLVWRG